MKKSSFIIVSLIVCYLLTGCSKSNDETAFHNKNTTEPTHVSYNTPKYGGPAITSVDTSDPELDRNRKQNNNDQVRTDHSRLRIADRAASKVSDLPEVTHAHIIVTDNNAYVAAKLERSSRNNLTTTIENKITRAVKSIDLDIDNVYVSVNPDFYNRMANYSNDIRKGRPISGLRDEFSNTIRRVFPTAR